LKKGVSAGLDIRNVSNGQWGAAALPNPGLGAAAEAHEPRTRAASAPARPQPRPAAAGMEERQRSQPRAPPAPATEPSGPEAKLLDPPDHTQPIPAPPWTQKQTAAKFPRPLAPLLTACMYSAAGHLPPHTRAAYAYCTTNCTPLVLHAVLRGMRYAVCGGSARTHIPQYPAVSAEGQLQGRLVQPPPSSQAPS
jgi:hypothetical protein